MFIIALVEIQGQKFFLIADGKKFYHLLISVGIPSQNHSLMTCLKIIDQEPMSNPSYDIRRYHNIQQGTPGFNMIYSEFIKVGVDLSSKDYCFIAIDKSRFLLV
jgi:hypothetical protein